LPSKGIAAAHRCRIAWPTSASVAVTSTSAPAVGGDRRLGRAGGRLRHLAQFRDIAGIVRPPERRAKAADIGESTLCRVPDARDLPAMEFAQPRIPAQQFGIALDWAELVVEFMAEAADQAADRHQMPHARQRHRQPRTRRRHQVALGTLVGPVGERLLECRGTIARQG
jgi:hypothetical protein